MAANEPGEDGERGVIVNTASTAAWEGQFGQAAYTRLEGRRRLDDDPARPRARRHGIRVMAIAPGPAGHAHAGHAPRGHPGQALEAQIPFPSRLGRPEEFAALVRHIVENRYLNGEVIRLDGALRAGPR